LSGLLYSWIEDIRRTSKSIKEGQTPLINLTLDQVIILQLIDFDFKGTSTPNDVSVQFQSHVEDLKRYQVEHGHMDVSAKEDTSLFNFVSNVRQSMELIQKGQTHPIELTLDQINALEEMGFDPRPKRGHTIILGTPSISYNSFKRQRVEDRHRNTHSTKKTHCCK